MFDTKLTPRFRPTPRRGSLNLTFLHATVVIVLALLTLGLHAVLERALEVQRYSAAAIELTERQAILTQRIASLTGQTALGSTRARAELRPAIESLAYSERLVVNGDAGLHLRPAGTEEELRALYGGGAGLDAVVGRFLANAREVVARAVQDPAFTQAAARVYGAAQTPVSAGFAAAVRQRQRQAQRSFDRLDALSVVLALGLIGTFVAQAVGFVRPLVRRASRLTNDVAEFARIATTDPLTGMLNARGFHDRGTVEIQKAKRYDRPLSLLVIDPDQLDTITRTHGPAAGDSVLQALTAALSDATRTTDLVGRVGGEAFAILLPETDPAGARLLAERLRERISTLSVPVKNCIVSCTVSIGVAAAEKGAMFFAPTLARADEALFEAKARGRNRVFVNAA